MALEVNQHVSRLNRFLPFDADYDYLFQEYVEPDGQLVLPTRALQFLEAEVAIRERRLIVLTGDAGHGKTYLCSKLLEHFGMDAVSAAAALRELCDGRHEVRRLDDGRVLRIVKDMSESSPHEAAAQLVAALADDESVAVVCANEGRLRSTIACDPDALRSVEDALEEGLRSGRLDVHPHVRVLNLNFQSVASPQRPLVRALLQNWAVDQRRWSACKTCDARAACPIFENHRVFAHPPRGRSWIASVEQLLRTAERIGAVITVRELLILCAYAITGGLTCPEVHRRSKRSDWQHEYLFSENLFGARLTVTHKQAVRSLRELCLLDPGQVALRSVDDLLTPDTDEDVGLHVPLRAHAGDAAPTTRAEARTAALSSRALMRFLRRRDFFGRAQGTASAYERLGFRHAAAFEAIVADELGDDGDFRHLRDRLIVGLEAVQGLRRSGTHSKMVLIDPAFASSARRTSIIARRLSATRIAPRSQSAAWARILDRRSDMPDAVDWSDRKVVVEIDDGERIHQIHLDLLTFEFVMRAGEGLDAAAFFDAEVRRITAALTPLAERPPEDEAIMVLRDGQIEALDIDVGNVIRGSST
jgi:hypothetical protein